MWQFRDLICVEADQVLVPTAGAQGRACGLYFLYQQNDPLIKRL